MVKFSSPRIEVSGTAKPARIYVPVQAGTAVASSTDRLTIQIPGAQPAIIEVRENTAGTGDGNNAVVAA